MSDYASLSQLARDDGPLQVAAAVQIAVGNCEQANPTYPTYKTCRLD
jgi:hypothetical protein